MAFYDLEDETIQTLKHVGKIAVFATVAVAISWYFRPKSNE
jgi:hypothetical protein